MDIILFATKNNNNFYKLELSKTLLHFIEYDFTYFWEQCIELGKSSRIQGGVSSKQFSILKSNIAKCHPYYEAQMNSDFEHVVLDCIIEYICHSENIGLEELWARCITPKNLYEKSIFARISEYKTNRAINQWANIMRIQEYAKAKLAFLFDGEPSSENLYRTRKEYFDLTFSVAAKELGFPSSELPAMKRYNPSLMPNAPFMLGKISKGVLRRISDIIDSAQEPNYRRVSECMRDQIGLDAFSYVKNLPRPGDLEMSAAAEAFGSIAQEIYMPDSFKSIIDLEFDKMLEQKIFMQKCEKCGKYFLQEVSYKGRFCNRVNTSGQTCREQVGSEKPEETDFIPAELRARCNEITEKLEKRIGEDFRENEFREWEQYLANMIENIRSEYSTTEDLVGFLDYSEKMYGEVKQRSLARTAAESNPVPAQIPKASASRPEPQKYRFPTLAELEERDNRRL